MKIQISRLPKAQLIRGALFLSLLAAGAMLVVFPFKALARRDQRTLTFAERVAYQRAIEEVYWRHRIWPKENSNPKPSLDAVMSQAQLEKKVADYLRKSQALEDYWQRPLTAEQLQVEMDRMAHHTKQPEVLRELFGALDNDPFIIAECLAKPALVDRSLTNSCEGRSKQTSRICGLTIADTATYNLPTISDACTGDIWTPTSLTSAPAPRILHTAVWTGSEMIVWGGTDLFNTTDFNTGGRYNPSTDRWTPTTTDKAPVGRTYHTAVWTGGEMIVWGGVALGPIYLNTGGRYNPSTDSWIPTSISNAADPRAEHTAVWTGSQMIVWGGGSGGPFFNTGGRYDPGTDSWTPTSITNAPDPRAGHTGVWTDTEMIVWGGRPVLNTGGKYNPSADSWTATSTTNAPDGRAQHKAVWTGTEMIVWGGFDGSYLNTGGRYNPGTDSWAATSITNAPDPRADHTAVWTDNEMIAWGGYFIDSGIFFYFNTGGRYNPGADSWTTTSATDAPDPRAGHTAVWTDSQMIVWGGAADLNLFNSGGRYCMGEPPPTPSATPTATPTPSDTPTPTPTVTTTVTPTATPTPSDTPTPTPIERITPTPRPRPTPAPRPSP